MKIRTTLLLALFCSLGIASSTFAQVDDAQMEAALRDAMPGPAHEVLKMFEGKWHQQIETTFMPGAEPGRGEGTAENTMILGGRFLQMESLGEMMGMNVGSMSILGHDNRKGKYFTFGIDELGTYAVTAEGAYDPSTKTLTMHGEQEEAGQKMKFRFVIKSLDPDRFTYAVIFEMPGDLGDMKVVETVFTRVK